MHHSQEAASRFIVARGQPAKLLEATEKAFDFGAVAVEVAVNHALEQAVFFTGNHDVGPDGGHAGEHRVRIIGFVSQYVARTLGGRQQLRRASTIRLLAGAEHHAQRVAQRVNDDVNFGRQPAAAAPEGFIADAAFFRLPAACAWARTTVESSITQSKSGSCTASNRRCQLPF